MPSFKKIMIASVVVIAASVNLSAVAALSSTETQCADYLNKYSASNMPSEATAALTYCVNNYSCADGLGGAVSDCSVKLNQWQVTQAIQAAKIPSQKTGTPSATAASTSQVPATTPTPAQTQIQTQEPVVTLPTTPAASETTQTNTKKTDKPSINWF